MVRRARVRRGARPGVLWGLIGVNVAVYVAWQLVLRGGDPRLVGWMRDHFLVSTPAVADGRIWTLLTSEFSHVDPTHLLFNLLALWVFGGSVHRVLGDALFVHLYVVGGVLASVAHVVLGAIGADVAPALGASGAVMAIAVVFAALFPRRTLFINFFIPVPAVVAVAGYVLLDLFGLLGGVDDGVAHAAHLGGALYGLLFWAVWLRPRVRRVPVPPRGRF